MSSLNFWKVLAMLHFSWRNHFVDMIMIRRLLTHVIRVPREYIQGSSMRRAQVARVLQTHHSVSKPRQKVNT